MKACNFASLDPDLRRRGRQGLRACSTQDRILWQAFVDDSETIAYEAEAAWLALTGSKEPSYVPECGPLFATSVGEAPVCQAQPEAAPTGIPAGDAAGPRIPTGQSEKDVIIRMHRVQSFFRTAVLASYDGQCALTGLAAAELLNASHIIPWSAEARRRGDPRNGICLNALHDRAFERGLISFDAEFRAIVSSELLQSAEDCAFSRTSLVGVAGRPLIRPHRFMPDPDALEYHRTHIFRR